MPYKITPRIAAELISHEAIVREAYLDSVDVWTWSVGITSASGHTVWPRYLDNPQTLRRCFEVYEWAIRTNYLPAVGNGLCRPRPDRGAVGRGLVLSLQHRGHRPGPFGWADGRPGMWPALDARSCIGGGRLKFARGGARSALCSSMAYGRAPAPEPSIKCENRPIGRTGPARRWCRSATFCKTCSVRPDRSCLLAKSLPARQDRRHDPRRIQRFLRLSEGHEPRRAVGQCGCVEGGWQGVCDLRLERRQGCIYLQGHRPGL